ncbi:hypothetical protein COV58_02145 [Candidatus Roizmanbacteria bacterium CG11_big_fil_rev_8_21_14_0_20_36_8]|uniref:Glycosyl transferase family 1 domain-containing protein n=1 Tax=Candidatus Roizmanbacteria bacterium CG11_big_fil_rev_8_21_14_0_20_36_8 TaxID=1974856 RepID=A0A2M6IUA3_9BACT|nr:MAG: hypothetical protein COV58_02145 [Candidatus Roizmanbacteria bacterium CG11_big_fil_rev_8_21_14_0_20_36_8]
MKICYIFSNFHHAHITGQAGVMNKLILKASENNQVFVISNTHQAEQITRDGVSYYLYDMSSSILKFIVSTIHIGRILRKIRPDIIHVNGALMSVYISFINILVGCTQVILLSETIENIPLILKWMAILSFRSHPAIFVTSNYLKMELISAGIPERKIHLIRIGLGQKFIDVQQKTEATDILYFGDSNINRGFDFIVHLAEALQKKKFTILLRYTFAEADILLKRVSLLPNVSVKIYPYKEPLEQLLMVSKLIILPFRWMLIRPPISILEAMALRKCVITSLMKGNEEIIDQGKTGFMVDFKNKERVISLINKLLDNPSERKVIGTEASKKIQKMYSKNEYEKIFHTYHLLLNTQ